MRTRSALFVTAGVVGAAVGGFAIASALSDPDQTIEPIALDTPLTTDMASSGPPSTDVVESGTPTGSVDESVPLQGVEGLEQLEGTLSSGDDPDDWYVAGVEVDFGPDGWITTAPAFDDYDGDGNAEPLLDELRGLEGRSVTLGVRYEIDDDDRDDADAFTIEGLAYRDATGGSAPWQTTPPGVEASRDDITAAAEAAVGEGAVASEIERENEDGWTGWDVEVRSAEGREYQVYLDHAGTVVDVRLDND
jgi:hypothetical protein